MLKFILLLLLLTSCSQQEQAEVPLTVVSTVAERPALKLCVVGDIGTGSKHQYAVARALEKEECSKILIPGDIIYYLGLWGEKDPSFQRKFYRPYKNLIEVHRVPFVLVMGNHDWYWPGSAKVWLRLAGKLSWLTFPHYYYFQRWEEVCFLGLDTQYFRTSQTKFFTQKLQESYCKFTIAMGHHPYRSSGWHGDASGKTKAFLEQTIIGHVDLYLAGHDHQLSDEGKVNGTHLVISGGGGGKVRKLRRKAGIWGIDRYGYLVVTVTDQIASLEFRSVEGEKVSTLWQDLIFGQGVR